MLSFGSSNLFPCRGHRREAWDVEQIRIGCSARSPENRDNFILDDDIDNIAPSQDVLVIRFNPQIKERSLDQLRWGLDPSSGERS